MASTSPLPTVSASAPHNALHCLPQGMRATRATRALAQWYDCAEGAAFSAPEVIAGLAQQGVVINKVTAYRLLERFVAAGALRRWVDSQRVTRFALVDAQSTPQEPRFECDDCHRQYPLTHGVEPVASALQTVLASLAAAGHKGLAIDLSVHGRCADCAHSPEAHQTTNDGEQP